MVRLGAYQCSWSLGVVPQIASAVQGAMPATGAGRYVTQVNPPAPNAMTVIIQPRTRRAHIPELFNIKLAPHDVKVELRGYFSCPTIRPLGNGH